MVAAAVAIAVVVAAAVVLVLALRGGKSNSPDTAKVAAALRAAGCSFRSYAVPAPPGGRIHVSSPTARITWPTSPPSGGVHFPSGSVLAFYGKPIHPAPVVQDLEDGAVVIWYGTRVSPALQARLEGFYQQSPERMLGVPYPALGTRVALAAWTGDPGSYGRNGDWGEGQLAVCDRFDAAAFAAFRDAFRDGGPERRQPPTG
jgi:hypothetical protein